MTNEHELFDLAELARRRDRAAAMSVARGDAPEFLLERVAEDVSDRLSLIKRVFDTVAVVGAHHGLVGRRLRASGAHRIVVDVDASAGMLALCGAPKVLAEPEILPFGDGRLDLIVSGLALQLANDLPGALVQMRRALRPDGLLLAAVLGGDSLMELRDAFVAAEAETTGGVSPRVLPVGDVGTLGGLLQRAGFAQPVVDSDRLVVSYPNPIALMHDLRLMGATNVLKARRRVPLRRDTLRRVGEIYQERYGRADGRIPATFEIITLTAWVPHDSQQKPLRPGSATARLADVLSTRELPLKR